MNITGKRMRKATGQNRHELHHAKHSHKSEKKIRRMGWTRHKAI
jgi:hypothetical protein